MKKTYPAILFFACSLGLMISCTKKGDTGAAGATGPTGPAGPSYTGAISGHVSLFDQYGTKVLTGLSGVALSLNGAASINPDNTGFYMFPSLTTGVYHINASFSGYGATMLDDFQFLSDTLNKDVKLSAIPSFAPTAFSAYQASSTLVPGDSIIVTFSSDTRARECIVFLSNTSAVSNQPANYLLVYTKAITATNPNANPTTKTTISIPLQDLYDAGFAAGSTVYYAAYGYAVGDVSAYEDLTTGKTVYNAVSTSSLTANALVP